MTHPLRPSTVRLRPGDERVHAEDGFLVLNPTVPAATLTEAAALRELHPLFAAACAHDSGHPIDDTPADGPWPNAVLPHDSARALVMVTCGGIYGLVGTDRDELRADEVHVPAVEALDAVGASAVVLRVPVLGPEWGWHLSIDATGAPAPPLAVVLRVADQRIIEARVAVTAPSSYPRRVAALEAMVSAAPVDELGARFVDLLQMWTVSRNNHRSSASPLETLDDNTMSRIADALDGRSQAGDGGREYSALATWM